MAAQSLHFEISTKTINDLVNLHKNKQLNLSPGFQRRSVWTDRDRSKLIESILSDYPLPAIFLYKRDENNGIVYDVIDGKQRLESIFWFMREIRLLSKGRMQLSQGFKMQLPKDIVAEIDGSTKKTIPSKSLTRLVEWKTIQKIGRAPAMMSYKLPIIEVKGDDLSDIIGIFVRINSTGKALTEQEKRHARFVYNSDFLKKAASTAKKFEEYFSKSEIFSKDQLNRMKHVELMCELMLSLEKNDVLNRKAAVDKALSNEEFTAKKLGDMDAKTTKALNHIKRMFPKLKETRLRQQTDFYTLAVLIGKFDNEGMILTDLGKNALAWDFLRSFCIDVDDIRHRGRHYENIPESHAKSREYLLTVSQMTDSEQERRKREQILREVIGDIFERKDTQRGYTPEQRRIIWDKAVKKKCCGCGCVLEWPNFTIDHITPHSRGGRTSIENSALMCQSCNSAKGNKMPTPRRRSTRRLG